MVNYLHKAASISALTLVSRVLGVIRDGFIAYVFGASMVSDIFFIIFRPFDVLRKMVSDGILSISFIPVFSAYLAGNRKDQAVAMFSSGLILISLFSAAVISFGIVFAPLVVNLLAPGYAGDTYAQALAALLLKFMLPYLFTILGVALSMGVLNSMGYFYIPAATPIILNLVIIGVTLFLGEWFEPRILVLGAGVALGGICQLCLQVPSLARCGMFTRHRFQLIHPGMLRAGKTIVPAMVGAAAFQINILAAGLMATTLVPGSVSFLYYAERLVQFPLALLVTSVSTVFLPALSGKAATRRLNEVQPAFDAAVRLVFFMAIPAMAGIMALNRPIVGLLFGRGAFDSAAVVQTGDCLFYLVSGLWAVAGTRLFTTLHYARSNIRLPFFAGLMTIGSNLVIAGFLVGPMGVSGLALSVALSSALGFVFLVTRSGTGIGLGRLGVCACRALFISGIMAVLVRWLGGFWLSGGSLVQGIGLFATIGAGAGFFFFGAALLGAPEISVLKKVFLGKNDHG
ncbi:MAG: murein biosynthesis integral membrane protein MurJ [Desulfobacterales bacterium]|nr:murein biosynthesis integral membrane protein MurJ [Desulfobacterales bacterium]